MMISFIHVKYKLTHVIENCVQFVFCNYDNFQLHVSFATKNKLQMTIAKCNFFTSGKH